MKPRRGAPFTGTAVRVCALILAMSEPGLGEIVAEYDFNDGSADDISGNGHDGTVVGDPTSVPGFEGLAMSFDGIDDYVVVAHHADLEPSVFSITVWLRIGGVPDIDSTVLAKWEGNRGYRLIIGAGTGVIRFELGEGSGGVHVVDAPFRVFDDAWTTVTVTYDGVVLRLYLDGSLVREVGAAAVIADNDANLFMAAGAPLWEPFAGALDAIVIDDTPASDADACASAGQVWDVANNLCASPFVNVAVDLGVDNTAKVGFGACLVDINQDGWVDLYYVNGSENPISWGMDGVCPGPDYLPDEYPPLNINTLFMNNGDGTFTEDVAPETGLDDGWNAMRNVFGDYDNNGLRDMFSHNFIKSTMYHAVSGPDPMLYEDWNDETGVNICLISGTGASWVDLNFDGWLDLYTVQYNTFIPDQLSYLYLSDGDGTFTEVTAEAGMDLPQNAMGVTFADYDNDGDQDVFVTNSYPIPTRLYRHDGVDPTTGIPQFTDVAVQAGVAVGNPGPLGVGVGWGDYNNDGYLDLLFSRTGDSRLWRNDGPDGSGIWRFTDVTAQGGFNVAGYNLWGGNFADLDNDGWLDVMLTNRSGFSAPNLLFMNNRDGTWREVAEFHGMDFPDRPQLGFVPGDIDNDGDLDVVLVTWATEPSVLFRNDGRGNNWIQFRLKGTMSNRDAVGARITLTATPQPGQPG
ncbi:MAG: VCBS repeat-containing protein, partial [Planctomycetes bacterium]|nr:VCBS repeat-containing protein [Planctomycetota bacterium]